MLQWGIWKEQVQSDNNSYKTLSIETKNKNETFNKCIVLFERHFSYMPITYFVHSNYSKAIIFVLCTLIPITHKSKHSTNKAQIKKQKKQTYNILFLKSLVIKKIFSMILHH